MILSGNSQSVNIINNYILFIYIIIVIIIIYITFNNGAG